MEPTTGIAGECCALLLCVHWDEMAVSVYLARGSLYYSRYDNSRVIVTEPNPSVLWPLPIHHSDARLVTVDLKLRSSRVYIGNLFLLILIPKPLLKGKENKSVRDFKWGN